MANNTGESKCKVYECSFYYFSFSVDEKNFLKRKCMDFWFGICNDFKLGTFVGLYESLTTTHSK